MCGMESERGGGLWGRGYGLPRALCTLAMTHFTRGAVCGGAHGPRPTRVFAILQADRASALTVLRNEEERRGGALPLPRAGKSAKRRQWRRKRAGFEEVLRLAGTTVPVSRRLARRWAREPRPYESATRGAMGGRPQGSPLRKRYKRCEERIPQSRLRHASPL